MGNSGKQSIAWAWACTDKAQPVPKLPTTTLPVLSAAAAVAAPRPEIKSFFALDQQRRFLHGFASSRCHFCPFTPLATCRPGSWADVPGLSDCVVDTVKRNKRTLILSQSGADMSHPSSPFFPLIPCFPLLRQSRRKRFTESRNAAHTSAKSHQHHLAC